MGLGCYVHVTELATPTHTQTHISIRSTTTNGIGNNLDTSQQLLIQPAVVTHYIPKSGYA